MGHSSQAQLNVAFEVGEVYGGKTKLEEYVLPCGVAAGLEPVLVRINDQEFTKTVNCRSVDNMSKGTNTNRIVRFRQPCPVPTTNNREAFHGFRTKGRSTHRLISTPFTPSEA